MGKFVSRVVFCVATELVALVITDKIWAKVHPQNEKTIVIVK